MGSPTARGKTTELKDQVKDTASQGLLMESPPKQESLPTSAHFLLSYAVTLGICGKRQNLLFKDVLLQPMPPAVT